MKEVLVYNDLSITLVVFLSIFFLIDKFCNENAKFHLKIIWIVKNFISFFLILIYENSHGLDQISYFNFVINNTKDILHFGNLEKLIDINNPTVNFLLPLKIVNFIFNDSWFMQKLFQNLLYLGIVILLLKILIIVEEKLKDNVVVIYFFSLLPSFFLFSSLITKDVLIVFMISVCFYSIFSIRKLSKKNILLFMLSILALSYIYLLRYWVTAALTIALLSFISFKLIRFCKIKSVYSFYFALMLIGAYYLFHSTIYNDVSFRIYTEIFERIKVEHFFPEQNYEKLFVNAGTRFDVLLLYPEALFKTIFNPFLDKMYKPSLLLFSLENLIILSLLFLGIRNLYKLNDETLSMLIFIIIVSHFYLPIGYLNSGTTLRYALQAKVFLLFIVIFLNSDLFILINSKLVLFFNKISQYTENYKSKNY